MKGLSGVGYEENGEVMFRLSYRGMWLEASARTRNDSAVAGGDDENPVVFAVSSCLPQYLLTHDGTQDPRSYVPLHDSS